MALFVFANVILRYFFNSGLTWAEEASRYLFIWLIFMGAIVAYKDNAHLGVDTLVNKLSPKGKRILFIINNILLLVTMALCVDGTWKITLLTANQVSASMQLPMNYVYVSGLIASVSMVAISAYNIYRLVANKLGDKDVIMTSGEDQEKVDKVISGSAGGVRKL
ncbi:MAG: TRAP transporter small permease [Negativicutes bacterium]|nr:TRAP transporter small permease [Negativicutes bacterium]